MSAPAAEACCPFDGPRAPVSITDVLDRLTHDQLRDMVLIFSVRAPLRFEQLLLEFWEHDHPVVVTA